MMLCIFLLSSCGESTPPGYAGSGASAASDTLQPIVAPPRAGDSPPLPGMTGAAKTPDGLPALSARGINTKLFAVSIDNEMKRIERLENAVQELRNDFDAVTPAIVRLVAIEKDIQSLVSQLEVLTGGGSPAGSVEAIDSAMLDDPVPEQPASVPAPPSAAPAAEEEAQAAQEIPAPVPLAPSVPAPESGMASAPGSPLAPETFPPVPLATGPPAAQDAPSQPVPPPASPPAGALPVPAPSVAASSPSPAAATVQAMRVGQHPGKVRIVLDIQGKTAFKTDLDNGEKILLVEMPEASWATDSEKIFADNPLLLSARTEAMEGGGTRLILALKTESTILYSSAIGADAEGGGRIVIDLKTP